MRIVQWSIKLWKKLDGGGIGKTGLKKLLVPFGLMLFLFAGCDPKRFDIVVKTSAIEEAYAGEVGYARAKLEYELSDSKSVDQIRSAILRYCKDCVVSWSDERLLIDVGIPVGRLRVLINEKCPIALVLSDEKMTLQTTKSLEQLNRELNRIDSSIKAGFRGCKVNMTIVKDTREEFSIEVFGVFVDQKPYAHGEIRFDYRSQKTILFDRSNSDDVWYEINPFFMLYNEPDDDGKSLKKIDRAVF